MARANHSRPTSGFCSNSERHVETVQPADASAAPIEWAASSGLVDYEAAVQAMEARVARIAEGRANELIWLLEHPPLYTAGTSARDEDLVDAGGLPVYRTGRGGQFTYHGPGQRVVYVMADLRRRGGDVRRFVCDLERWIIATLSQFGIQGETRQGRIGVWVDRETDEGIREDKIAALGIRVRRSITYHGLSLNVAPNLDHFAGIVPCGISEHGVTSLADLGVDVTMGAVDAVLRQTFADAFGPRPIVDIASPVGDRLSGSASARI